MQNIDTKDWRLLYILAAIAAFASIALIPIQMIIFILWPLPTEVLAWFERFDQNWLIGLLSLDLLLIVQNAMITVLYLAFIVILWPVNRALILLGSAFAFIGLSLYYSSNVSFEMLNLSQQYFATTDFVVQNQLLGAGRMALAVFVGTSFDVYYVFSGFALLLFSYTMLNGQHFSKLTAYFGLIAGGLMLVPATAGILGLTMSILSLIPWIVFCYLAGRRLIDMSHK
ncbi:MAG: hypothetical protein COB13_004080 [OCS116 cluster bacterium]|nr:hypothetical protein [OCS116 cluster bacterium]